MIKLSQRDPQWGDLKLGESNLTINRWGCTTTALSMLSDYFQSYFKWYEKGCDSAYVWRRYNS